MANVRNILTAKGLTKLPIFSKNAEGKDFFDFEKIIPVPESLWVSESSFLNKKIEIAVDKILSYLNQNYNVPASKYYVGVEASSDDEKEGAEYVRNIVLYGYPTWYGFCHRKWGTTRNSWDTKIVDDDTIMFTSSCYTPLPLIKKLAADHPELEFHLSYADDYAGDNCGTAYFHGREERINAIPDGSEESFDMYMRIWGIDGYWSFTNKLHAPGIANLPIFRLPILGKRMQFKEEFVKEENPIPKDAIILDKDTILFATSGGPGTQAVKRIADKYPGLRFTHWYSSSNNGVKCGYFIYTGDNIIGGELPFKSENAVKISAITDEYEKLAYGE